MTSLCLQISILHSDINAPKGELELRTLLFWMKISTMFSGVGGRLKTLIWNFPGLSKIFPSDFLKYCILPRVLPVRYTVVGLTSHGYGDKNIQGAVCAPTLHPTIFARVTEVKQWIKDETAGSDVFDSNCQKI